MTRCSELLKDDDLESSIFRQNHKNMDIKTLKICTFLMYALSDTQTFYTAKYK